VITDNGRWAAAAGYRGGGVVGREGKLASLCNTAAVSDKPDKQGHNVLHCASKDQTQ